MLHLTLYLKYKQRKRYMTFFVAGMAQGITMGVDELGEI